MRIIFLLFLVSCSALEKNPEKSAYPDLVLGHTALIGQRLIPRKGNEGFLTNQACLKYEGKDCVQKSLLTYDMNDPILRDRLANELKFACKMGNKRFRICKKDPGFCRQEWGCIEWKKKLVSRKTYCSKEGVTKKEYIPVTEYQRLIDGSLECRSGY